MNTKTLNMGPNQKEETLLQIETQFYRDHLHNLYLMPNKVKMDLFFEPFDHIYPAPSQKRDKSGIAKKISHASITGYFGHRAGKWILRSRDNGNKPFVKEFTSKKKAIKFMKENFVTPFLLCVRYKRGYDLELADVPVQFYMHNLGEDKTVETVIYRYDWQYIMDKQISSDEYFQKHKEYILGTIDDEETKKDKKEDVVEAKPVVKEVVEEVPRVEKPTRAKQQADYFFWLVNFTAYTMFAATLGLWIYSLIDHIEEFNRQLIIMGAITGGVYILVLTLWIIKMVHNKPEPDKLKKQ